MRKHLTFSCMAALAALAPLACLAASDKIDILLPQNQGVGYIASLPINEIGHISYGDPQPDGSYREIEVNMGNGDVKVFPISELGEIKYSAGRPDSPLQITIEPHHTCATLNVSCSEPDTWFRMIGYRAAQVPLTGIMDASGLAENLVLADIAYLHAAAESLGKPLGHFKKEDIFWEGNGSHDWFPDEIVNPGQEMVLCVYTGKIENNDMLVTSEPQLFRFKCKDLADTGIRFDVRAVATSTSVTLKADPIPQEGVDTDITYSLMLFSQEQIAESGLQFLLSYSLGNLEQAVYGLGGTGNWEDYLYRGHGEKTWKNMRIGDRYVGVAMGVEYGMQTTVPCLVEIEIPEPVITDPCTFSCTATQLSPSEIEVAVIPSNPSTRWTAMLVETERLQYTTPSHYISNQVYWINAANKFQWDTTPHVHQGAATLNTHDVINGEYLKLETDYTLVIFGLDEEGARTTDIQLVECRTHSQGSTRITLNTEFYGFNGSSQWSHSMKAKTTPSDPDMTYVTECLPATNQFADLRYDDADFISRYIDVQGPYLALQRGVTEKHLSFSPSYDPETEEMVFDDYIMFSFGYNGEVTSPLYVWRINAQTGETTPIRGN